MLSFRRYCLGLLVLLIWLPQLIAQPGRGAQWTEDGSAYYRVANGGGGGGELPPRPSSGLITPAELTPAGAAAPLEVADFELSASGDQLLIFTNTQRVWRYETRGDYWVLDRSSGSLRQLGSGLAPASLMFAKLSPDGTRAAYVSERNLYLETLADGAIRKLTDAPATGKLINGTFDWAYEEEFDCRDGFRWSPDGASIAYWQIDANTIRDFYMINTTDSIYSYVVPVEYPKVGESPSACRVGVVDLASGETTWMQVPGDSRQHYIPRMEWAPNGRDLILQQLNRKQNESVLYYAEAKTGQTRELFRESDEAWVDVRTKWPTTQTGWTWIDDGQSLLWISEMDGWSHIHRISADGSSQEVVTKGDYDVIAPAAIDEAGGWVYFMASPDNATQRYLYRTRLDGRGDPERLTPAPQEGSHSYEVSPTGRYAFHRFSNYYTRPLSEWVALPGHRSIGTEPGIAERFDPSAKAKSNVEFIQLETADGVTLDAWIAKPANFDPTKRYPLVCTVYGEPAGQTTRDRWGVGRTGLYAGDLAADGYIYCSFDNRGTPAPKGRAWRKAIYRKIGVINIRDQAMALRKLIETYDYIDTTRLAVHGWSGGGSSTLNLLFQYPELYQTGIAVAAVANQLSYDNIYQERYMGIPQENREDFVAGSPITHAKNLVGNLLYIHGTGDDNVHYQNAEMLLNELIEHNRQFQFMPYPNRSHGIYEGAGTRRHLQTLFTNFLRTHCPPGGK